MAKAHGREVGVLRIVKELNGADVAIIRSRMVVSEKYAQGLLSALVKNGYLQEESEGEEGAKTYTLTKEGETVLNPYRASSTPHIIHY